MASLSDRLRWECGRMAKRKATRRSGDITEEKAVVWLWEQGYEVFKNSGSDGPIDIVAVDRDGKILLIDVKTGNPSYSKDTPVESLYYAKRNAKQEKLGVQILMYYHGKFYWAPNYL